MAATTRLIHVRLPPRLTSAPPSFQLFSSSTSSTPDSDEKPPEPDSGSRSTSYFSDIKSTLKKTQQTNPPFPNPPKPFTFSPPNSLSSTPKLQSLEEIGKTLSEFRRRADLPPPPGPQTPPPNQHISFQDILQRNTYSKPQDSSFNDGKSSVNLGLSAIKASLSRLKPANPSERFPKFQNSMSLSDFKASFNMKPSDPTANGSPLVIGGTESVLWKELKDKKKEEDDETTESQFVKSYTVRELGDKLKMLRPEKKADKKDWFSFGELNERLSKLRKMELEGNDGVQSKEFAHMRSLLMNLKSQGEEKAQKEARQRIDILSHLGRTPSFMLGPPKEELVEKYFHPDNMSASEKLKLELQKVRDEFKMSESDCGSARVQVAQLTTKIHHLSSVLHKKDKHSRKGLQAMVQKRKSLLKYLRRTDWESYSFVLSKLGLRDNPDIKR